MTTTSTQSWKPRGIEDLEPAAWEALRAGTASVTAGPGAGKSEFLAQRASYLLETGVCQSPQSILAISFKRSAAANLRDRVSTRLPDHARRFHSMTFDAFSKSIVDRFYEMLPAAWKSDHGYDIMFSSKKDIESFFAEIASGLNEGSRRAIYGLSADKFLANAVGAAELPVNPSEQARPTSASEYAVQQWWKRKYLDATSPGVDFTMLNRLADLIIRSSPQLLRAIRATYPYVFIDEFQDTTYAQYAFLRALFGDDRAIVTVVGDSNQRIMGWAGALEDAFAQFEADFAAQPFTLASNFRSTQKLADLQHRFAVRLNPDSTPQQSRVVPSVAEGPVEVWSFPTADKEADAIAAWIASDIEESGRLPGDYALIARQKVAELEPKLTRALSAVGLHLRNDDALVGEIRLQDLLTDDLVRLLWGVLTLATHRGGKPQIWQDVTSFLSRVSPERRSREVGSQLEDDLGTYLQNLRGWLSQIPLDEDRSMEENEEIAATLTRQLADFVRAETAGHKRLFAGRPVDIDVTLTAFRIRLAQTLQRVDEWRDVADVFIDEQAVSLLTIHRSKGFEYHTVFFIGLDSDQWWSHARNTVESTMAFFVGASRAAERLYFTQCDERGKKAPLGEIYQDLRDGGVNFRRFD